MMVRNEGPFLQQRAPQKEQNQENYNKEHKTTALTTVRTSVALDKKNCRTQSVEGNFNAWTKVDDDLNGIHFEFSILGTSADDTSASPHVLSPPLMHSLQGALPFAKRGESFWLKYSLVRDGASLPLLLNKVRGTKHSIMAIETVNGEVFGAFTTVPWHIDKDPYGTGESFLWRMKHNRGEISESVAEQARNESDIDIFKYGFENNSIQMCHGGYPAWRLAVGGGCCPYPREVQGDVTVQPHEWGFGIGFDDEYLIDGTSSPCLTFNSPSLTLEHQDGSRFEVMNLEIWALTPCLNATEAEIMEARSVFLARNMSMS